MLRTGDIAVMKTDSVLVLFKQIRECQREGEESAQWRTGCYFLDGCLESPLISRHLNRPESSEERTSRADT